MPIEAEVEGVGILEFPDGTPDDVISRSVKKVVLEKEGDEARGDWQKQDTYINAADIAEGVLGRISLGGIGRLAGSVFEQFTTDQPILPGEVIARELAGLPPNPLVEAETQESAIRRNAKAIAQTVPTLGLAMAGQAAGVPMPVTLGLAMGAQEFEASGGDPLRTAVAAGTGAVIPPLMKAGAIAGGVASAAAANRGSAIMANPIAQKAAEVVAANVPVQALTMGQMMASEDYRNAPPAEQARMRFDNIVQNLAFGMLDVPKLVDGSQPIARRFESPAVEAARQIQEAPASLDSIQQRLGTPDVVVPETTEVVPAAPERPLVEPTGVINPSPVAAQAVADALSPISTPEKGRAASQLRRASAAATGGLEVEPSITRSTPEEGSLGFRREAPDITDNVTDQTAEALMRERSIDADATRLVGEGMPSTAEAVKQEGAVLGAVEKTTIGGEQPNEVQKAQGQKVLTPEQRDLQAELDAEQAGWLDQPASGSGETRSMAIPGGKELGKAITSTGKALKEAVGYGLKRMEMEGEGAPTKTRKFSERASRAPSLPKGVRKAIKESPRSEIRPATGG